MNIYFFTLVYPVSESDRNLYTDLIDEIVSRGHSVTVFRPDDGKKNLSRTQRKGVAIEIVRTGRVTQVGFIEKAINTILLGRRYTRAVLRQVEINPPDLVVYSTPPVSFGQVVKSVSRRVSCVKYLLLKDIFPANAVDIGLISPIGPVFFYFRRIEKALYAEADSIGVTSPANVSYLLQKNPELTRSKIHICPNSICPTPLEQLEAPNQKILEKYKIPKENLKLIYGGNLGKPQGVQFVVDVFRSCSQLKNITFVVIGSGTEFHLLERYSNETKESNLVLLKVLPKQEYLSVLASMDVGLIFLDERFTVPNYPSRVLDYMDFSLPILAATDEASDIGELLQEENCGLWSRAGDIEGFKKNLKKMATDVELRKQMGTRSRAVLVNRFSVANAAEIMLSSVEKLQKSKKR